MVLKANYDAAEDIPADISVSDLFEEREGKWILRENVIEGVKTEGDVARIHKALQDEKAGHRALKQKYSSIDGLDMDLEDIVDKIKRFPELEEASKGKLDADKIEEIASGKAESLAAPLRDKLQKLENKVAERDAQIKVFEQAEVSRKIREAVREAAVKAKVVDGAIEDVLLWGDTSFEYVPESGDVVTRDEKFSVDEWLRRKMDTKPHWFGTNVGGGATGNNGNASSFGKNPWSKEYWNITEQGKVFREDAKKARMMAEAHGHRI